MGNIKIILSIITSLIFSCSVVTSAGMLALLVKDASNLDQEEQAALKFAQNNGFSIKPIDASIVKANPTILDNYVGYWADSNTEPASWNEVLVIKALKTQIQGGKRLLVMGAGNYIAQYLGYGTVKTWSWNPVANDHIYLADYNAGSHLVFDGLTKWSPPTPPDKPEQELWAATPGTWQLQGLYDITTTYKSYTMNILYTRYGFCEGNCARFQRTDTPIIEIPVGNGVIMTDGLGNNGPALTHEWKYGPMGTKILKNKLTWLEQKNTIKSTSTITTNTKITLTTTQTSENDINKDMPSSIKPIDSNPACSEGDCTPSSTPDTKPLVKVTLPEPKEQLPVIGPWDPFAQPTASQPLTTGKIIPLGSGDPNKFKIEHTITDQRWFKDCIYVLFMDICDPEWINTKIDVSVVNDGSKIQNVKLVLKRKFTNEKTKQIEFREYETIMIADKNNAGKYSAIIQELDRDPVESLFFQTLLGELYPQFKLVDLQPDTNSYYILLEKIVIIDNNYLQYEYPVNQVLPSKYTPSTNPNDTDKTGFF